MKTCIVWKVRGAAKQGTGIQRQLHSPLGPVIVQLLGPGNGGTTAKEISPSRTVAVKFRLHRMRLERTECSERSTPPPLIKARRVRAAPRAGSSAEAAKSIDRFPGPGFLALQLKLRVISSNRFSVARELG